MEYLKDIGELEAIRRLTALLPGAGTPESPVGDDTAVLPVAGSAFDQLLTTDPVIEGQHFRPDAAGEQVGHKAVARVLSDIASMGGEAESILVNVVAPAGIEMKKLEAVYRGMVATASRYGARIVGGDLAEGPVLELHVFGLGRVPAGTAVRRRGGTEGDLLYVTGALGGSPAGRHLSFEPRLAEGQWLREGKWAAAMIDLSDGLATDLRHLLQQSRTGAWLDAVRIPLSETARQSSRSVSPLDQALFDGEDFELLFCVNPDRRRAFEDAWAEAFSLRCTCIGCLDAAVGQISYTDSEGVLHQLEGAGWEHFR